MVNKLLIWGQTLISWNPKVTFCGVKHGILGCLNFFLGGDRIMIHGQVTGSGTNQVPFLTAIVPYPNIDCQTRVGNGDTQEYSGLTVTVTVTVTVTL